jgi:Protein of unknown function (DUF4089)
MTWRPRSKMPARKPARRARRVARAAPRPARKAAAAKPAEPPKPDPLDAFILAGARALGLKIAKGWMPAVRANLAVTLRHARSVESLELPDDAEPAPVYRA